MEKPAINNVILRISELRKSIGLSHQYMADKLNISPSAYNKIENQKTKLSVERLIEIQRLLGVPLEDILGLKTQNIYNQEIHDNQIGLQHVENLYQESKEMAEKHIESLKEEIAFLKTLISK